MRLYYICQCCQDVYMDLEVQGPPGMAEVAGLCPECQMELGLTGESVITNRSPSYN